MALHKEDKRAAFTGFIAGGILILVMPRLLNYIVPDFVHVMSKGRVVKSGGKELALELEASGYAQFEDAA